MRPAIPHDTLPDTDHQNSKRSTRMLAEAGYIRGRPVKQTPHCGLVNEQDTPYWRPEPPEDVA